MGRYLLLRHGGWSNSRHLLSDIWVLDLAHKAGMVSRIQTSSNNGQGKNINFKYLYSI